MGSTSLTTFANGNIVSEMRYKAWGEVRYASGLSPTDYTYTGQYSNTGDFGLMFYNARWYDSSLSRFTQADTIISGGAQGYDRYAYSLNNPVRYTDPSGHISTPCQYYGGNNCSTQPPDPYTISEDDIANVIEAEDDYEYWLNLGIKSVNQMRTNSGWWSPYLVQSNGMDVWKFLLKLAYTTEAYSIPGDHSDAFKSYMTDAFINKAGDFYNKFGVAGLYLFLGTREAFTDRAALNSQAPNWDNGAIEYRNTWEFGPGAASVKNGGGALYNPKADRMYPIASEEMNSAYGLIMNYQGADLYGTGAVDVGVDPPLPMAGKM